MLTLFSSVILIIFTYNYPITSILRCFYKVWSESTGYKYFWTDISEFIQMFYLHKL